MQPRQISLLHFRPDEQRSVWFVEGSGLEDEGKGGKRGCKDLNE